MSDDTTISAVFSQNMERLRRSTYYFISKIVKKLLDCLRQYQDCGFV